MATKPERPTTARPATSRTVEKDAHPSGDSRFKLIDRTLKRFQYRPDALIEVLHTAQEAFGFLTDDLLIYVARQLDLPPSRVYGVATFYHFFSLKPQGEHNCIVCLGTACYVKYAADILAAIKREYNIDPGQTTEDKRLSLTTARCLGSCGLAPVMILDGEVVGRATAESALATIRHCLGNEGSEGSAPAATDVREYEEIR